MDRIGVHEAHTGLKLHNIVILCILPILKKLTSCRPVGLLSLVCQNLLYFSLQKIASELNHLPLDNAGLLFMYTILSLFGKSPFAPLQSHMEKVNRCVHLLPELFVALENRKTSALETIATQISTLEHEADLTKNDIRNQLPKSIYLPVDRGNLLDILSLQDSIADNAEDVAVLLTLAPLELSPLFREEFIDFLKANIASYDLVHQIIKEMHELLESSFGGNEAEKVKEMVDKVAYKEHEVDLLQRKLLKKFFSADPQLSQTAFHLWQKIFEAVGAISNISEKLANRVRTMLELK